MNSQKNSKINFQKMKIGTLFQILGNIDEYYVI